MCMQCDVEALIYKKPFANSQLHLMIATRPSQFDDCPWAVGDLAIVRMNDPAMFLGVTPEELLKAADDKDAMNELCERAEDHIMCTSSVQGISDVLEEAFRTGLDLKTTNIVKWLLIEAANCVAAGILEEEIQDQLREEKVGTDAIVY